MELILTTYIQYRTTSHLNLRFQDPLLPLVCLLAPLPPGLYEIQALLDRHFVLPSTHFLPPVDLGPNCKH